MSYPFTLFERPNGRKSEHEMENILPEEEKFFRDHGVKISIEELTTGQTVVYADYGAVLEDGTPDEIVFIVQVGMTCEVAMSLLRQKIEKAKS